MKYMLLLQASAASESDAAADTADLDAMGAFNEQLIKAGVLLAGEGLEASSSGARVEYSDEPPVVTDGPFAETKELISGFWILQVASRDEAIEWARRVPLGSGRIEVRRVLELADFDPDNAYVQQEVEWREKTGESRTA